jgi:type III secretion protein C
MRNHSSRRNSQIPCLGGLPLIGAAFSKKSRNDDKKNVIIYVRPQIIHSIEEYKKITQSQEAIIRRESAPVDFDRALNTTKETPVCQ